MSECFTTKHGLVFTKDAPDLDDHPDTSHWTHQIPRGYISVTINRDGTLSGTGVSDTDVWSIEFGSGTALAAAESLIDTMIDDGLIPA